MAIKLYDEWVDGEILEADDLNDTFDGVEIMAAKGTAQIPFTTLKSTGTWTNEGNLAADRTTQAQGASSTINTGSTTATFSTDKYDLISSNATEQYSANDGNAGSTDTISVTGTCLTEGYFDNIGVNSDPAGDITISIKKNGNEVVTATRLNDAIHNFIFSKSDYSEIFETSDTFTIDITCNTSTMYTTTGKTFNGSLFEFTSQTTPTLSSSARVISFQEYSADASGVIIVDSETLTLSGNENIISVYNPSLIPTDTSIKVTLNDGTKNISAETTLSENNTSSIPLTATPVTDSTLELHYTLATTVMSKTSEWYGYGVYKS